MAILGRFPIAALVVIGSPVTYFFIQLYDARMLLYERQKLGLISDLESSKHPPELRMGSLWLLVTNFFFVHLLYLESMIGKLPRNAHYQSAFGDIAREQFSKEGVLYLDLFSS